MSAVDTTKRPSLSADDLPLAGPRLPQWAPLIVAAGAIGLAALAAIIGTNWFLAALLAALVFVVVLPVWAASVEGKRSAVDRLMSSLVWVALTCAIVPLGSLLWMVTSRGVPALSVDFFTSDMSVLVLGGPGGIQHALIGTLLITLAATVISVPVGLFTAIYLVEYGAGSRLSRAVTFLVDVMTGIPSIVAGLFAYALFVLIFGPGVRMGIGGAVALSLLMIPIVVRSTEEMLKLVPNELREASYALGVPKWRTISKVVLPTAMSGIVTGVTLAVARVIGETAPLLTIAGDTDYVNWDLFAERMATLPVYIYYSYLAGGDGRELAWGAAFVLIAIVMILNIVARFVGKAFAPKTGR